MRQRAVAQRFSVRIASALDGSSASTRFEQVEMTRLVEFCGKSEGKSC